MRRTNTFGISRGWGLLLTEAGFDPARVLRRAGLPADLFSQDNAGLSSSRFYDLWRALEVEAGDVDLGLSMGQMLRISVFDPPVFAAMCSRDLRQAAKRIAQYKPLVAPIRMTVDAGRSHTTLGFHWPKVPPAPASFMHGELAFWVALVRLATGVQVQPTKLRTPEPPRDAQAWLDWAGCAVESGPEAYSEMEFSAADAARPFLMANDAMWTWFEPDLRRRLTEMTTESTIQERVHAALLELLPAGSASVTELARSLGMSVRTLQRRLRSEDTSFQAVLNATREALARHYLTSSLMPAAEISFLLGYADPNSFYRAFQTWTGETPEAVRAAS
jgi:AraC-like DNA-binding protein